MSYGLTVSFYISSVSWGTWKGLASPCRLRRRKGRVVALSSRALSFALVLDKSSDAFQPQAIGTTPAGGPTGHSNPDITWRPCRAHSERARSSSDASCEWGAQTTWTPPPPDLATNSGVSTASLSVQQPA